MSKRIVFGSRRILATAIGWVSAVTLAIGLVWPAAASAVSCTGHGTFTAATSQSCTIDQYLTGIHVVLVGGRGGTGANFAGGHGARVTGDLAVNAYDLYYVNVGGNGGSDGTAGVNGGGAGGTGASVNGAGGGGASDVRGSTDTLASRLFVAAGGGGGGAGTSSGVGANADGAGGSFGCLIICGTSASGSLPGTGEPSGQSSCLGQDGDFVSQGTGGNGYRLGAGGGGGYAGGGGGGEVVSAGSCVDSNGGSGGGGSSFVTASAMNATIGTDTSNTPAITITAPFPTTSGQPGISGTPTQGQTLTEAHAPWTHSPTAYTYQWERCDTGGNTCVAVGGGGSTYNLTFDDVGHTIEVQETASNFYGSSLAGGTSGTVTSAPTPVVGAPPAPTSTPTINGNAVVGQTLTEVNATWSNPPLTGRTYQWQRCNVMGLNCYAISGATGQTYTATAADAGSTLDVQEFASNSYGEGGPATSAPSSVVSSGSSGGGGGGFGGGGGGGSFGGGSTGPVLPPVVSRAAETKAIWREAATLASLSRTSRAPIGTTFSFALDRAASVRFAFNQRLAGRRTGNRCVAQTKRSRNEHRCSRTVTIAAMTFAGHGGDNKVKFYGHTSSHFKLPLGHYTLVITASNNAGTSMPQTLSFLIVR